MSRRTANQEARLCIWHPEMAISRLRNYYSKADQMCMHLIMTSGHRYIMPLALGRSNLVKLFLEAKADFLAITKHDLTPLIIAKLHEYSNIVELLEKKIQEAYVRECVICRDDVPVKDFSENIILVMTNSSFGVSLYLFEFG
jgi:hypothetical protein